MFSRGTRVLPRRTLGRASKLGGPGPAVTRRQSLKEAPLYLIMRDDLAAVELLKTTLDLRQEVDTLHYILEAGIRWQLLQSFKDLLLNSRCGHEEPSECTDHKLAPTPVGVQATVARPNASRLSCGAKASGRKHPALRYEVVGAQTYGSFERRPRQLQALVRRRSQPRLHPTRHASPTTGAVVSDYGLEEIH